MVEVRFFYRNISSGFSIHRVFKTIENNIHNVKSFEMPFSKINCLNLIRNIIYSIGNSDRKTGVNHITGDIHYIAIFLSRKNTILTIHDTNPLLNNYGLKRFLIKLFWFTLPIKRLDHITCISKKTYNELVSLYPNYKDKFRVVYNPLNPRYSYIPKAFNKEMPVILHIGTSWNKNLKNTIVALSGIPCHLRIVGKIDSDISELLEECGVLYSVVLNLSDEEVYNEYVKSDIISFASVYEGFGMPIVEGQAIGRAVLTSDMEPMKDIAGKNACLVDPLNIESLKNGFIKLINNEEYREAVVLSGLYNVKRFDLSQILDQYNAIYKNITI